MLGDLPCFKYTPVVSIDDMINVYDRIEYLMIGNNCLKEYTDIDWCVFVNMRVIDVGCNSLTNVESVVMSSMMIDD